MIMDDNDNVRITNLNIKKEQVLKNNNLILNDRWYVVTGTILEKVFLFNL